MRVLILLNPHAGKAGRRRLAQRIAERCSALGIAATIETCRGARVVERARAGASAIPPFDVVVAAGGDGTISCVAGAVAGGTAALGVLPLGTLNHFARDLGIPLDLDHAVDLLAHGRLRHIDVGEVNGRVFVNNSVIGLYPAIVIERERQRNRFGRAKWVAHVLAAVRVSLRFPRLTLDLSVGGVVQRVRTPLLFVGNNEYRTGLSGLFRRQSLTGGRLVVHVVRREHWWGILGLLLRVLLGLPDRRELDTHLTTEFVVDSRRRMLRVALDGEVVRLAPPLVYRTRPGGLAVMTPAPGSA